MFVSDYDFIDKEEEKTGIKFSNTNQRILVSINYTRNYGWRNMIAYAMWSILKQLEIFNQLLDLT